MRLSAIIINKNLYLPIWLPSSCNVLSLHPWISYHSQTEILAILLKWEGFNKKTHNICSLLVWVEEVMCGTHGGSGLRPCRFGCFWCTHAVFVWVSALLQTPRRRHAITHTHTLTDCTQLCVAVAVVLFCDKFIDNMQSSSRLLQHYHHSPLINEI